MIWTGIGWLGGLILGLCAVPQVWKTYRTRKARDLSWTFLGMWFGGEVLTLAYIMEQNVRLGEYQIPLLANYLVSLVMVLALLWAKGTFKDQ